jgi:2-haloacid dehalogenase
VRALTGHRWVTFDCFGTLIDWQAGFTAALTRVAGDKAPALVRAYHVWERRIEGEQPHRSYKDVLAAALAGAAADVGVALSAADVHILRQSWNAMRPFADVEPLLAELRGRGWRLAVLTNCDDDLFEVTHRTFRTPFDLVLTAERVRGYKPARWHFRAFELLTRVDRRDWVHVACSWYHDVAPARALGVTCVWLDRERTGENPAAASVHVETAADALEAIECVAA